MKRYWQPFFMRILQHKLLITSLTLGVIALAIMTTLRPSDRGSAALEQLASLNAPYVIYAPASSTDKSSPFTIEKISYSQGVTFYTISEQSTEISVSQQPIPKQKIPVELPKTRELQVKAGNAVISRFGATKAIVNITNSQSMILVNIPFEMDDTRLTAILESLSPVRD